MVLIFTLAVFKTDLVFSSVFISDESETGLIFINKLIFLFFQTFRGDLTISFINKKIFWDHKQLLVISTTRNSFFIQLFNQWTSKLIICIKTNTSGLQNKSQNFLLFFLTISDIEIRKYHLLRNWKNFYRKTKLVKNSFFFFWITWTSVNEIFEKCFEKSYLKYLNWRLYDEFENIRNAICRQL